MANLDLNNFFIDRQKEYPGRVCAYIGFHNDFARQMYAGADIFLMPSMFEPCGLSQMISMKYGTIPIVRETGGLAETVTPYNKYDHTGDGFGFKNANAHELLHAIETAVEIYKHDPEEWQSIQKRAMKRDNSWKNSAQKYTKLYQDILTQRK